MHRTYSLRAGNRPKPRQLAPQNEQSSDASTPQFSEAQFTLKHGDNFNQQATGESTSETRTIATISSRYSLNEELIFSKSPPSKGQTQFSTLPHIVFRDPYLPWNRTVTAAAQNDHNHVPWFALLSFTAEELQIDETTRANIFPGVRVSDTLGLKHLSVIAATETKHASLTNLVAPPDEREVNEPVQTICVPGDLFANFFYQGRDENLGSVEQFRLLSHIHTVATDGMLAAYEGQPAISSITMSHRFGPVEGDTPITLFAHLVSLEDVEHLSKLDVRDRVLMTSLYSWSYTSVPPKLSPLEHLRALSERLQVLHTDLGDQNPTSLPPPSKGPEIKLQDIVTKRLRDGYNMVRYRTPSGEQASALVRGPFTPRLVKPLEPRSKLQVNIGVSLQIFDAELEQMDITYSSAWELGRKLSLEDSSFAAALGRLRRNVNLGMSRDPMVQRQGLYKSQRGLDKNFDGMISRLHELNSTLNLSESTGSSATNRLKRTDAEPEGVPYSPNHASRWSHDVSKEEHQMPRKRREIQQNSDLIFVQNWLLAKVLLEGIPISYIIPEPSFLPPETLRFFHVDENWIHAIVDGALGRACLSSDQLDQDHVRSAIKAKLEEVLAMPTKDQSCCQQMPKYGLLLRSETLKELPDLLVKAVLEPLSSGKATDDTVNPRAHILAQRILTPDTLLCLFDRELRTPKSLELTIPSHQMNFMAATGITDQTLDVTYKKLGAYDPTLESLAKSTYPTSDLLHWSTRTLKVEAYAKEIYEYFTCHSQDPRGCEPLNEQGPTSSMFAFQLNQPIYNLQLTVAI